MRMAYYYAIYGSTLCVAYHNYSAPFPGAPLAQLPNTTLCCYPRLTSIIILCNMVNYIQPIATPLTKGVAGILHCNTRVAASSAICYSTCPQVFYSPSRVVHYELYCIGRAHASSIQTSVKILESCAVGGLGTLC